MTPDKEPDNGQADASPEKIPTRAKLTFAVLLIVLSTAFAFAAIEGYLRILYPKYEYAANARFTENANRIWVRLAHSTYQRAHPDSGLPHLVYHNNLALRQHRDFSEEALSNATNIGFFGDSFTENLRLPSPYSFTEPLDFLLNETSGPYNTLNFGIDGYGTDQSYQYFRDFTQSRKLDHVFYLFCVNDLRNIYQNQLFDLDEDGTLLQNKFEGSSSVTRLLRRFHTTYLLRDSADAVRRLLRSKTKAARDIETAFHEQIENPDLQHSISIFQAILRKWESEAKAMGASFHVVLLPRQGEHKARRIMPEEIAVLDLYEAFSSQTDNYRYSSYRFQNDPHWNEAANSKAARYLFQEIRKMNRQPATSQSQIDELIRAYYTSFDGWRPAGTNKTEKADKPALQIAIKEKYLGDARKSEK